MQAVIKNKFELKKITKSKIMGLLNDRRYFPRALLLSRKKTQAERSEIMAARDFMEPRRDW